MAIHFWIVSHQKSNRNLLELKKIVGTLCRESKRVKIIIRFTSMLGLLGKKPRQFVPYPRPNLDLVSRIWPIRIDINPHEKCVNDT